MTKFKHFVIFLSMRNRGSNCAQLPTTASPLLVDASPIVNSINLVLNATSGSWLNIGGQHRRYKRWRADLKAYNLNNIATRMQIEINENETEE